MHTRLSVCCQASVKVITELNLDHVAHFVPDLERAGAELEKLGFTLTPFSAQSHGATQAGAGNRCAMFKRGYLEFLTPTADTDIGRQLRAEITRYVGPHLIAFGTAAPEADHQRLAGMGFGPLGPIALQREIETVNGRATARFTVVRVPPGTMAEGRIQYCQHHTPELLWQSRWLAHANGAVALNGVILCVADPEEAARRYTRFTGLPSQADGNIPCIATAHGYLMFIDPETLERRLHTNAPALPWIAGCILESEDITASSAYLRRSSANMKELSNNRVLVDLPASVGGILILEPKNGSVPFWEKS